MLSEQERSYTNSITYELAKMKKTKDSMSYFVLSSQKCNIAFPYKPQTAGMDSRDVTDIKTSDENVTMFHDLIRKSENVLHETKKWSAKFAKIIEIASNAPGPVFIYTRYVNHGILPLASILLAMGWSFMGGDQNKPTFGIWSPGALASLNLIGLTDIASDKDQTNFISEMKKIFNASDNFNGSKCKIIISNVVEGISLRRVSQVHICEPWWNISQIEQIVARGIRFCSHSDIPNKNVDVYYHISTIDTSIPVQKPFDKFTVDQRMYRTSFKKHALNIQFEIAIKESSIDCNLNKNGNISRLERILFPEINDIVYYDRSLNSYYVSRDNLLVGINIDPDIWPPTSFTFNNKTINNILVRENINCFLSNNNNFLQLKQFAIENGESKEAWDYCHNMYVMNKYIPELLVKYNAFDGTVSKQFITCLYNKLLNPSKYNLTNQDVLRIENFIIKPEALLVAKKKYIEFLRKKKFSDKQLSDFNFVQLETLYKSYNKKK